MKLTIVIALGLALAPIPYGKAMAVEYSLPLDEAVRRAVEKNEGLQIERESVAAAKGALRSAHGAYDPVLGMDFTWLRSTEPLNSSFPGAPIGPELQSTEAGLNLSQLLPT